MSEEKGKKPVQERTASQIQRMLEQMDESAIGCDDGKGQFEYEVGRLQDEIKILEKDVKMKERMWKLQIQTNQSLENRQKMLSKKITGYEEKLKKYQNSQISKSGDSLGSIDNSRIDSLTDNVQILKSEVQNLEKDKKIKDQMIATLRDIKTMNETKNSSNGSENEAIRKQLEGRNQEIQTLKTEIASLKNNYEAQLEMKKNIKEDNSEQFVNNAKYQSLEKTIKESNEIISQQNSEITKYKQKISQLKDLTDKVDDQLSQMKKRNEALEKKSLKLQQELKSIKDKEMNSQFDFSLELNEQSFMKKLKEKPEFDSDTLEEEENMVQPIKNKKVIELLAAQCQKTESQSRMSFLNMVVHWAETKIENFCHSIDSFE